MKIAKKIFTIVCDDIRFEADGRISLMGVIEKDLTVNEIPIILPTLSIMISLENLQIKISEIEVIVKAPKTGPEKLRFVPPPAEVKDDNDAKLFVKLVPFRAKAEGVVEIQIKIPEIKKAMTIHSFRIIQANPLD
ncbi:MAG: hypothetical protein KAI40_10805 [Desulfobacterales bacterium]|nr:hypothetical protein [Desulfobacterales bacterium]